MSSAVCEVALWEGLEAAAAPAGAAGAAGAAAAPHGELQAVLAHTLVLCSASNSPSGSLFAHTIFATAAGECAEQSGAWASAPIRLWLASAAAAASAVSAMGAGGGGGGGGGGAPLTPSARHSAQDLAGEHVVNALAAAAAPLAALADAPLRSAGGASSSSSSSSSSSDRERATLLTLAREALDLYYTLSAREGGVATRRALAEAAVRAAAAAHAMVCLCAAFDAAGGGLAGEAVGGGRAQASPEPWAAVVRRLDDSGLLPAYGTPAGDLPGAWARLLASLPAQLKGVYPPMLRLASAALLRLYQCYGGSSAAPPALVAELRSRMGLLLGAGGTGGGHGAAVDGATFKDLLANASALGVN